MVAAVQMLLAQTVIFFFVSPGSLWSLPFLFSSLSFHDYVRDSLSSFHCLAMKRMPLGGDKPVLQGVKKSVLFYIRSVAPWLQLHGHRALLRRKQNDAELISATECSLLIMSNKTIMSYYP